MGQIRSDEKMILQLLDPEYKTEQEEMANKNNASNYTSNKTGGYLRAPSSIGAGACFKGGYLSAPSGGFLPLLPLLGAPLMGIIGTVLGDWISKKISGSGIGDISHILPKGTPDFASGGAFYNSMLKGMLRGGISPISAMKKMKALFGHSGILNKTLKSKQMPNSKLLMGNLLMPLIRGHLKSIGTAEHEVMPQIENQYSQMLDEPVTHENIVSGGSIMGTLTKNMKHIFKGVSKLLNFKKLAKVGTKITSHAIDRFANKHANKLADKGVDKAADYIDRKLAPTEIT
jgi:hypothetical protein